MAKSKSTVKSRAAQLRRFKALALEVQADESPDALDRAFARLDAKRIDTSKPAKRKAKRKG